MASTALVVGLGVTGEAAVRHLVAEGWTVVVADDRGGEAVARRAEALGGIEVLEAPGAERIEALVRGVDLVVPSPGVPVGHPVYAAATAAGVPLWSEIELAWRSIGGRRLVGITGTNGKTTVTTLVAAMLVESGLRAVAAGNIGLPLVDAIHQDVDVIVAEVSSFQLEHTVSFRPAVATWLNFAEDHLDWHPDLGHYAAAKVRIWRNQTADDVAVVNAEDPIVMDHAAGAPSRVVTFGLARGDHRIEGGQLVTPEGPLMAVADISRALPHELANALAATATAGAVGAGPAAIASVLAGFQGLPHRVQLVGHAGGVRFFDDSKATTPASVLAAIAGFDAVVLIAGGRNKGLDLSVLRQASDRIRSVVAIGDAADEIAEAFHGVRPVVRAWSMDEAVRVAASSAVDGDVVLLSPGCASFDWYGSYAQRGDDFARAVREVVAG